MGAGDTVNVVKGRRPADYHCDCKWCKVSLGELRSADGSYYSRLERNQYYDRRERGKDGHLAKTPLHAARWAIQRFTQSGDWVLDPTIGAGTTAVEAITQGRNAAGMEVSKNYFEILKSNIVKNLPADGSVRAPVRRGDARRIGSYLDDLGVEFQLVVSNPPYSGDESMPSKKDQEAGRTFSYEDGLPNLAFLKEGDEYWSTLGDIYEECAKRLKSGGFFTYAVKDMTRNKEPFLLHRSINDLLVDRCKLKFVGTAFLKHHPATFRMNTYPKMYEGRTMPAYQTIGVFQK